MNDTQDKLIDPYKLPRNIVTVDHFLDARLYDDKLEGSGWTVPRSRAKAAYDKWLRYVRSKNGWEDFRRPLRNVVEEIEEEDGSITYNVIQVPHSSKLPNVVRRSNKFSQQPTQKEQDDTKPRIFTPNMGKEISRRRLSQGMTQFDLAKKINVDVSVIRDIELGGIIQYQLSDPMVKKLANAIGLSSIKYIE